MTHDDIALDEPDDVADDGPAAFDRYVLHTQPDGSITGRWTTDDDEDRGHPTTEASSPVRFANYEDMKKRTGLTHTGISGVQVTVLLDGKEV